MVVDLPRAAHGLDDQVVDLIFHALADRTRRDILTRAISGGHSVSALARHYPFSFAAVQKHIAVLAEAGLVTKQKRGREQLVATDMDGIGKAQALLDRYEQLWRDRGRRFEDERSVHEQLQEQGREQRREGSSDNG